MKITIPLRAKLKPRLGNPVYLYPSLEFDTDSQNSIDMELKDLFPSLKPQLEYTLNKDLDNKLNNNYVLESLTIDLKDK